MAASKLEAALDAQRQFMTVWGDTVEQMLGSVVYMAPVQEEEGDVLGFKNQAMFSLLDLFGLYRTALLRDPRTLPIRLPARSSSEEANMRLRNTRMAYSAGAFVLRAIKAVQVLVEMHFARKWGAQRALRACFRLEVLKLALKMAIMSRTPFAFYVDEDALEEVDPAKGPRAPEAAQEAEASATPEPVEPAPDAPAEYVGPRSGKTFKAISSVPGAAPSADGAGDAPAPEPGSELALASLQADRTPASLLLVAAEALFHGRPLLHLLALMRLGRQSAFAWLLALAVDFFSLNVFAREIAAKTGTRASSLELAEFKRRWRLLAWALLRSPFFDRAFRRPAETLDRIWRRIPLLNLFNVVELCLALQPFYFTTSGT